MNIEIIKQEILYLENQLLQLAVREHADKLYELLDEELTEFCSSGKVYHYRKGDTFPAPFTNREIVDFSVKELAALVILAIYKLVNHNENDINRKYTMRSSIWKFKNDKWKMVFHQRTPA